MEVTANVDLPHRRAARPHRRPRARAPVRPALGVTTGLGSPVFTAEELDAVEAFVAAGGGLVVLAESEQEKYGTNLGELTARFGVAIANETVQDYGSHRANTPSWVLADVLAGERGTGGDILARVHEACFYRAGTLIVEEQAPGVQVLACTLPDRVDPRCRSPWPRHGAGRVVVLADSDLFRRRLHRGPDHQALWSNLVQWRHRRARRGRRCRRPGVRQRRLEAPARGDRRPAPAAGAGRSVDLSGRTRRRARPRGRDGRGRRRAGPRLPTSREYLAAVGEDLRRGSTAAAPSRTSPPRSTSSAPTWTAATTPSTSCCSRCTRRTGHGTRASRR